MKTLFMSTSSNETDKYFETFRGLGWGDVDMLRYDIPGITDSGRYESIKASAPDFIVYIGSRWGIQPAVATLCKINYSIAPMVHLCSDAADPPWAELLREYHTKGAFTVQVAIDGTTNWPTSGANLTLLTPVDPAYFPNAQLFPEDGRFENVLLRNHDQRTTVCGWAGNGGSGGASLRSNLLAYLLEQRLIGLRIRSNLPFTYESYCEYLTGCRIALNIAHSGTEAVMHVKGRVIEAALAGALLLENKGAPTSDWFEPGVDYLEYSDHADCARIIRLMSDKPYVTWPMALSMRKKVLARHGPLAFWTTILERIGMKVPSAKAAA